MKATGVATEVVSKFDASIGTFAYRISYLLTLPPPLSAGAVHFKCIVVCRRSVTVTVSPVGASGGSVSTLTLTVPTPTPKFPMLAVVAVIVWTPSGRVIPLI